jgi:hypothetical protein
MALYLILWVLRRWVSLFLGVCVCVQVKAKERMKQQLRRQELDQDQLLIDWVRLTDQQERNNRLAKKILERESLFREWDMQRQHLKDVQAMGPTKIV